MAELTQRLEAIDWRREKVMLFVDGEVPQYDIAAGYFIVFEYLKIFLSQGFKIVFWPFNRLAPQPYTDELESMGIEVVHGDMKFEDFIERWGRYVDISIVCRPEIASSHMGPIARHSPGKIVYWAIDLYYLRQMRQAELSGSAAEKQRAQEVKAEEVANMQRADASLFFNPHEVEIIRAEDPDIKAYTVPWIQLLNTTAAERRPFEQRRDLLFVGGFLHTPNTDAVTWLNDEIIPGVREELPGISVDVAGGHVPPEIRALDGDGIRVLGFVPEIRDLMQSARAFVVPLRFGAGFKGKIAMAQSFGLPVVTTRVGAEGMGLKHGETALIADDADGFAREVVRVYNDPELWERLSLASLAHVEDSYSVKAAETAIMDIIGPLAPGTVSGAYMRAFWDRIKSLATAKR